MFKRIAPAFALLIVLPAGLPAPGAPAESGAAHDFDWNLGTWKTHIQRLKHRLSGSNDWVSYEGVVTVRPLLDGAANVEEVVADGPSHIEDLAVRTYDRQSQQWTLTQADAATGSLGQPMFGRFTSGRGVFYDVESIGNRTVIVRQTFYGITPQSYAFEQAFSDDGGRTWEPNFRAHLERTSARAPSEGAGTDALSHDFDFNWGTWRTHIRHLRGNSLDSQSWGTQTGTVTLRNVWNGRAMVEEISVGGADGFSGVTLYLFDPRSREWSQTFIDASDGSADPSMIGTFSHGRGELFSQGTYGNATVLYRGVWSSISANAHRYEIDVSQNGGTSWRPVFVASLTRIGPGA